MDRVCRQCQRELQLTEHKICMYCGAEITEEQHLTDAQLQTLKQQRQRWKREEQELNYVHKRSREVTREHNQRHRRKGPFVDDDFVSNILDILKGG